MATERHAGLTRVRGRILVPLVAAAVCSLAALVPQVFVLAVVVGFLAAWVWLVDRDYVLALSAFMALMPLWMFLKWVEWPSVAVGGSTVHLATMLKEVFMIVFFLHWLVSAVRSDRAVVRITPAIIGFFAVVAVALLQAGLSRYPMLLRPYVETFLLVGVPLLSIDLTRDDVERLLVGTAVGGGVAAVVALYHAFVDPQFLLWPELIRVEIYKTRGGLSAFFGPRLQSFTGNPNNLGRLMLVTCVVAFGFAFRDSGEDTILRRSGFASLFALATIVLMLTRSRDDIVFLAVAIALFIVVQRRTLPLLFGLSVFGLGAALNFDQIYSTFEILITQGNPRFDTWISGIRFYGWELLTGVGDVDSQFTVDNPYDSTYFRLLLQVGVVGLVLFLLFNLRAAWGLLRRVVTDRHDLAGVLLVVLVTLLGSFAFSVSMLVFPFSLYYWFVLALAIRTVTGLEADDLDSTRRQSGVVG